MLAPVGCFQCVKGNKFESDSQQNMVRYYHEVRCFQCVKGNKFESDSQLVHQANTLMGVVSNVSKIANLTIFFALKIVYLHQQNDCVMFIFMLPPGTPPDSEEERKSRVRGFLITSIVIVVLYVLLIVLLYYLL